MHKHLKKKMLKLLALYVFLSSSRPRRKRLWVHAILSRRENLGEYHRLVQEMRLERKSNFITYFRMSPEKFDDLLLHVEPLIVKQTTCMRKPIPPAERLAVTLRFLVTGDSYQTIAFSFRIHKTTVAKIVPETCAALWNALVEKYTPRPNMQTWKRNAAEYERYWQFPNCIGSIDGKHITIQAPHNSGSLFYNYKKSYSVVLLAVADAQYRFTVVDVGAYGRQSDGGVLSESAFGQRLLAGTLDLPPDSPLPGGSECLPHVFVGDEAFPLKENLLRPYPGSGLPKEKRIFNYRLSRARRVVENAFGILSSRFRVFRRPLAISPSRVDLVVKACTILHNFLREDSTHVVSDEEFSRVVTDAMEPLQKTGRRYARLAINNRNKFAEYFSNQGAVSWQENIVFSTYHARE